MAIVSHMTSLFQPEVVPELVVLCLRFGAASEIHANRTETRIVACC